MNENIVEKYVEAFKKLGYTDEKISGLVAELSDVSPSAVSVLSSAIDSSETSYEKIHATARLKAMVAAGQISKELASATDSTALAKSAAKVKAKAQEVRDALIQKLLEFNIGDVNPFIGRDKKLVRMIVRGDSKKKLLDYFNNNTFFLANMDLMESEPELDPVEDLDTLLAIQKFKTLYSILNSISDSNDEYSFQDRAKLQIKKYDKDGKVAKAVDSGANSVEVFELLGENPKWNEDAYDFLTRDQIDLMQDFQVEKYSKFQEIVASIKDLDDVQ